MMMDTLLLDGPFHFRTVRLPEARDVYYFPLMKRQALVAYEDWEDNPAPPSLDLPTVRYDYMGPMTYFGETVGQVYKYVETR